MLQRLACPGLPLNNTPGPLYNPFITVDYVDENNADTYINEGRSHNKVAVVTPPAMTTRKSYGRNQPYAAAVAQRKAMNPTGGSERPAIEHLLPRQRR